MSIETSIERKTLSFYRYVSIADPHMMMNDLRPLWTEMGVLGRVYLAHEGINAQVSVPHKSLDHFQSETLAFFPNIAFKIGIEEPTDAFDKLKIKVRKKLVSDGLDADSGFDASQVGSHLDAEAFHRAIDEDEALIVDMRNHYECEVGHFKGALQPSANTFREALPEMIEKLKGQEDKKILLYCTGGIRCEKASAWFKFKGFKDVNQLHGGIIDYARQIQESGAASRFVGKNFVFDKRMGERITGDVLSECHQCGQSCDEHTNCSFEGCNRLFIQCASCAEAHKGCCSKVCLDVMAMPKERRVLVQQTWEKTAGSKFYWSRTRYDEAEAFLEIPEELR